MTQKELLKQLNVAMHKKCMCALKKTALNPVFGTGSPTADIMFIGEAPGKKEDEKGMPFIGAAGKMLSKLLESINLRREDVYITNIVKYRPPNNRDPLPQEIVDCWPWLTAQIQFIQPKIIIPLGRHALERFVPGKKVSQDHGQIFYHEISNLGTRTFLALYHPAAALYNGSLRETLFTDFAKIPDILKEIEAKKQIDDTL